MFYGSSIESDDERLLCLYCGRETNREVCANCSMDSGEEEILGEEVEDIL